MQFRIFLLRGAILLQFSVAGALSACRLCDTSNEGQVESSPTKTRKKSFFSDSNDNLMPQELSSAKTNTEATKDKSDKKKAAKKPKPLNNK